MTLAFLKQLTLKMEVTMNQVKDIMTRDPACCTSETVLKEVAQLMIDNDCGEIPVVNNLQEKKPIGVITDRDICCRAVAKGSDPNNVTAGDCMTSPCVTVGEEASLQECCDVMEKDQIRRVPVVDKNGACCGIVSQGDLAEKTAETTTGHVLKSISKPTETASGVSRQ
jgi:CBS domain-containing protein